MFGWQCSHCGWEFALDEVRYTCDRCRDNGLLTLSIDYARVKDPVDTGDSSIWRYRSVLPVPPVRGLLPVGGTPLVHADRLGARVGIAKLYLKNEALNPTGSLKDRASALVVAKAVTLNEPVVATASSGNAAAALAGQCASVGLRCITFVPEHTPKAKVVQLACYGALVVRVHGDYDTTVRLTAEACREWGWYCRNTAFNPYTAEGKKTVALEIVEQLGKRAPDAVVVPVGDGNILFGVYRGFRDAVGLGWIDRIPRLIGVQAAFAPAVHDAWRRQAKRTCTSIANTTADSINVGTPQDGARALAAIYESDGAMATVPESEIKQAAITVARYTGILSEPASAITTAALPQLLHDGHIRSDDHVVCINTGSGLKTLSTFGDTGAEIHDVAPTLNALKAVARSIDSCDISAQSG